MKTLFTLALVLLSTWATAQVSYTFTNCGATGRLGPTQSQVNAEYTSPNPLFGAVTSNSGIQYWTVPATADYSIEAFGAQGGDAVEDGGKGAYISGEFSLTQGEVIRIVVGQRGINTTAGTLTSSGYSAGGAGGSYVVRTPYNSNASILAVAGGGGGAGVNNTASAAQQTGLGGTTGTAGLDGKDASGSAGGTNGNGGAAGNNSGSTSGAGFFGNSVTYSGWATQAFSFTNGSNGSEQLQSGHINDGGFGGGGGGAYGGGGGGGYSGGGAGHYSPRDCGGGGGGSYNNGTNQLNVADSNTGQGRVVITRLFGVSIQETAGISCYGETDAILTAQGTGGNTPYSFVWSTSATTATISNLGPGTYSVTMTDNAAATAVDSFTVIEPDSLEVTIETDGIVICNGDENAGLIATPIGGTPGFSYMWSNGDTIAAIYDLGAGVYDLTVTDTNGCTANSTTTLTDPDPFVTSEDVAQITCKGNQDGNIDLTTTGGEGSYTYTWSNGSTTSSNPGLSPGFYNYTVTDSLGCANNGSIQIEEPEDPLTLQLVIDQELTCSGDMDGALTADVDGGWGSYSFTWSNAQTSASLTGLDPGTYTVTVEDLNGCQLQATETLDFVFVSPTVDIGEDTILCEGNDITLDAENAGLTFTWSTGETTQTILVTEGGEYTVSVTSSEGCTTVDNIILTEVDCLGLSDISTLDAEVYPNPTADGMVSISLNFTPTNATNIQLIDLAGKVLKQQTFNSSQQFIEFNLDVTAGIYILHVQSGENILMEKLIVK